MEEHELRNESFSMQAQSEHQEPGFQVLEAEPTLDEAPVAAELSSPKGSKPVVCLMGEFSAGKSTLSNLLVGSSALPVNVTATQLPPVWMSKGDEAPYRVALDGQEFDIDLDRLEDVSVDDTAYIRIFHDTGLLDRCDLIDMPGISDPNMDAEVWQRVIPYADAVIWCTHATQAWRQSEAAVWSMLPKELYAKSLLLLTRADKILSERDKMRVVKRVGRETVGLFRGLYPISLTRALGAEDNIEKWEQSGAAEFTEALDALLCDVAGSADEAQTEVVTEALQEPDRIVAPKRVKTRNLEAHRPNRRPSRSDNLFTSL